MRKVDEDGMPHEFKAGDVLVQIGHSCKCVVQSVSMGRYFVRWIGSGDSMLWIAEVDKEYVKVGMDDEEEDE